MLKNVLNDERESILNKIVFFLFEGLSLDLASGSTYCKFNKIWII